MNTKTFAEKLPGEAVKIEAPLINGESFLRNLPFPAEGPYSSSYGGALYALATKGDVVQAHSKARGRNRTEIEWLVGLATDEELFNN